MPSLTPAYAFTCLLNAGLALKPAFSTSTLPSMTSCLVYRIFSRFKLLHHSAFRHSRYRAVHRHAYCITSWRVRANACLLYLPWRGWPFSRTAGVGRQTMPGGNLSGALHTCATSHAAPPPYTSLHTTLPSPVICCVAVFLHACLGRGLLGQWEPTGGGSVSPAGCWRAPACHHLAPACSPYYLLLPSSSPGCQRFLLTVLVHILPSS